MDRLCTERHPGVWHFGGLENDGVTAEEEKDAARHRQEKREATRLGKLQSHTEA